MDLKVRILSILHTKTALSYEALFNTCFPHGAATHENTFVFSQSLSALLACGKILQVECLPRKPRTGKRPKGFVRVEEG